MVGLLLNLYSFELASRSPTAVAESIGLLESTATEATESHRVLVLDGTGQSAVIRVWGNVLLFPMTVTHMPPPMTAPTSRQFIEQELEQLTHVDRVP